MLDILLSTLLGVPVGILCSLAAWWFLFYVIVPKIHFSPSISKVRAKEAKSNFRYRIAFQNFGKRDIVDAEIYVKLRIKGLRREYQDNESVFSIPLGYDKIPKIISQRGGNKHIIRLDVIKIEELVSQTFPEESIIHNFEENPDLLENLLSLGTSAKLQIFIFGYDKVSGTRKVFESKFYHSSDIIYGMFSRESLSVIKYKKSKDSPENRSR